MPLVIAEAVKEKKHPVAGHRGAKTGRPGAPAVVGGQHRWRYAGFCYFALCLQCTEFAGTVWHRCVMQVLIRRTGTSLYWNTTGRWTRSRERASDLGEVCRAVLLCLHQGWKDAELVICFEQMSGEMTVPVAALPRTPPHCPPQEHRRESFSRRLLRWTSVLPFRRRKIVTFGCRRNVGLGGYGRR